MVKKINHIAIVVKDIDEALGFWENCLGIELDHKEDVPSQQASVAFLPLGDSEIELVQPTNEDSGMAKYLEKRGEGLHHICLEVEDINTTFLDLKEKGVRFISDQPSELPGRKMIFIHPKSANGVLIELYEIIQSHLP
jgi:methylmalonyl-CoA/ethylmalonyl-CoA epimerase